jgi:hypothetical protein
MKIYNTISPQLCGFEKRNGKGVSDGRIETTIQIETRR